VPTTSSGCLYFFFQAEDGIRDKLVTGVQTCALPILTVITGSGTIEVALFTVYPHSMTLRTGQTADFMAVALASSGDTVAVAVTRSEERRVGKAWSRRG